MFELVKTIDEEVKTFYSKVSEKYEIPKGRARYGITCGMALLGMSLRGYSDVS